ncbi:hypothetical protein Tco_1290218, partial [Tanacetum coccineum]
TAGNQTNGIVSIKDNVDAVLTQQYILLPLLSDSPQSSGDAVADDAEGYQNVQDLRPELDKLLVQKKEGYITDLLNLYLCVAYDDEDVGAEAGLNNLETTMNVSPIPITRIHKDHPKDQIIGDINSATQTRRMTNISEEHAMASCINKQRRTNHKDYQNCLFACFLSQNEPKKVIQALAYLS